MIVLGNLMTTGGIYLLGVFLDGVWGIVQHVKHHNALPGVMNVARGIRTDGNYLINLVIKYLGILFVLFALGGLASMVWYVIARRIETHEMKKRWLIIQKPCVSEEQ